MGSYQCYSEQEPTMTVKSEFQKFSEMTKRLLSVSKKEFNR